MRKLYFFLLITTLILTGFSGCNEDLDKEIKPETEINIEEFCSYVDMQNIDKTAPIIDEYLFTLPNDLDVTRKLQLLAAWLQTCPCIVDITVLYELCIDTTEIAISFKENEITENLILDILMTNPLKAVGYREQPVNECDCKDELFYYYYDEKLFMDNIFLNTYLLVGFYEYVQDKEITNYINRTDLFEPIDTGEITRFSGEEHVLLFVNTKKQRTCSQLKEIIQTLEQSPLVAFANFAFEVTRCIGFQCTDLMSYQNFNVWIKDGYGLSDLNTILQETNTRIKKPLSGFYVISTDKHSKGNALQMANYFHNTGKFITQPSFLYGNRQKKH